MFKIGIQMRERFWERDDIYGGISWTNQNIEQLWYPSHGIHAKKGVMLGAYTSDPENAEFFARQAPQKRFESALAQGERIHPGWQEGAFSSAHNAMTELQKRVSAERGNA